MRILIRYCLILFMYARARENLPTSKRVPLHPYSRAARYHFFPSPPHETEPPAYVSCDESTLVPPSAFSFPFCYHRALACTFPSCLIFYADFSFFFFFFFLRARNHHQDIPIPSITRFVLVLGTWYLHTHVPFTRNY